MAVSTEKRRLCFLIRFRFWPTSPNTDKAKLCASWPNPSSFTQGEFWRVITFYATADINNRWTWTINWHWFEDIGAAVVALAACQRAHSLGHTFWLRYVRKIMRGLLICTSFCDDKCWQTLFCVFGIAFIWQFLSPNFSLIIFWEPIGSDHRQWEYVR